jgi:hypothetical protein
MLTQQNKSNPGDTSIGTIKELFYEQLKNQTQRSNSFDLQFSDLYQDFEF